MESIAGVAQGTKQATYNQLWLRVFPLNTSHVFTAGDRHQLGLLDVVRRPRSAVLDPCPWVRDSLSDGAVNVYSKKLLASTIFVA